MRIPDIQTRITEIAEDAGGGDNEAAHGKEDLLLEDALRDIAAGAGYLSPQDLAREVIKVFDIDYERWYV